MVRAMRMVVATSMLVAVAACGTAAQAGRPFGNDELIKELAGQLTQADAMAYTATFALADNATVSIAHATDPIRMAYRYAGGMVLLLPDRTTSCKIDKDTATCADSGPIPPGTQAAPAVDGALAKGGMVRPETVIAVLDRIALNADAIVSETSRTLAGTNATCIAVTGVPAADQFTACVTSDGLLGQFAGTVDGQAFNIVLTHVDMSTDVTAFDLPRGETGSD